MKICSPGLYVVTACAYDVFLFHIQYANLENNYTNTHTKNYIHPAIHPSSTIYPVKGWGGVLDPISACWGEGGVTLDKSSSSWG